MKFLERSFYRLFGRTSCSDAYTSIKELPIHNWWEIHEGNLQYLFTKPRQPKEHEEKKLQEIWDGMVCEYVDLIGISKQYTKILEIKKQILLLKIQFQKTKDKRLKLFITIEEQKLRKHLDGEKETMSVYEQKSMIEENIGFYINSKTTTVIEYYSYVKRLEQKAAEIKANQANQNNKSNGRK